MYAIFKAFPPSPRGPGWPDRGHRIDMISGQAG